jgi:hypothetical protein
MRLALVLISTAAGLGLAEVVARATYGEGFASLVDPHEFHAYRPYTRYSVTSGDGTLTVQTNSLGWKDSAPRRVARDPAPLARVVFLGDSFTEGLGVPQEETMSAVAQERLNRGGRRWEVLNGGRISHSPLLEYQRLKYFLAGGYRADVVVVLPDVSDVQDELYYSEHFLWSQDGEPLRIKGALYHPAVRFWFNHLALVRWGYLFEQKLFPPPPEEQHPARLPWPTAATGPLLPKGEHVLTREGYEHLPPEAKTVLRFNWMGHPPSVRGWTREGLDSMCANLLRIQRLTREHHVRLLMAIYPVPPMLYTARDPALYRRLVGRFGRWFQSREYVYGHRPAPSPTAYERRLRAFCRRHGIELVDLFGAIRGTPDWYELYLPRDVHFDAAGHRLVGEAIAAAILAGGGEGSGGGGETAGRSAPDGGAATGAAVPPPQKIE